MLCSLFVVFVLLSNFTLSHKEVDYDRQGERSPE